MSIQIEKHIPVAQDAVGNAPRAANSLARQLPLANMEVGDSFVIADINSETSMPQVRALKATVTRQSKKAGLPANAVFKYLTGDNGTRVWRTA